MDAWGSPGSNTYTVWVHQSGHTSHIRWSLQVKNRTDVIMQVGWCGFCLFGFFLPSLLLSIKNGIWLSWVAYMLMNKLNSAASNQITSISITIQPQKVRCGLSRVVILTQFYLIFSLLLFWYMRVLICNICRSLNMLFCCLWIGSI